MRPVSSRAGQRSGKRGQVGEVNQTISRHIAVFAFLGQRPPEPLFEAVLEPSNVPKVNVQILVRITRDHAPKHQIRAERGAIDLQEVRPGSQNR
jgi:hypothetical protein